MMGDAAGFDVQSIELAGGWRGEVLWDGHASGGGTPNSCRTPTANDWRAALEPLVNGHGLPNGATVLKQSRVAQVIQMRVALPCGSVDVVCKYSRARGVSARVLHRLRGSRELGNWRRGLMLLQAGIATARPLVLLQRTKPRCDAWLVTEVVADALDLDGLMSWHIYRMDDAQAVRVKRAVVGALADLCARMDRRRLTHRDFKASNILVTGWRDGGDGLCLWLIDLDGLRTRRIRATRSSRGAVVRLAASLTDHRSVTRADCARFLRAYLEAVTGRGNEWRREFRAMARDVQRYNQLAKLRKRGKIDGFTGD